jgi:hypothetical protein
MKNLKTEILNCLQNLKGSGKFATIGSLPFTLPGLCINEKEEISFPLSENEAKKLIDFAQQAPFGKGSETIIDTSVRNTWEIDSQHLSFRNPSWENHLGMILENVKEDLGLKNYSVNAHLYKMLIYEEGGFFLPHKDSEKEKGMFGTLVIGLPSNFSGGELSITFDKETVVADFSDNNPYETDFLAFYADCDHEVKRVNSGYRVCLVYNLIQQENLSKIEWSSVQHHAKKLAKIIEKEPLQKPYTILLGHQYTPENFSYDNLKLNDRLKAQVILDAAKQLGFYAKLCLVTSFKSGAPEYDGYDGYYEYDEDYEEKSDDGNYEMAEVYDESLDIEYWANSEIPALSNVSFEEDDLLVAFELDEGEPIVKENSGYMGNYGPDLSFWYHYGAVMVWSKDVNADLYPLQNSQTKINWIKYFLETSNIYLLEKNAVSRSIRTDLIENNHYRQMVENYNPVIDWLIFHKNEDLLLNLSSAALQKYFENIDAEYWLKFLESFPKEKQKTWIEKITLNAEISTVEKLITFLNFISENTHWVEAAINWACLLPDLIKTCYQKDKKRINSQSLEKIFSIEYNLNLEGKWSLETYNTLVINTSRDEVHHKFAPLLLNLSQKSTLGKNLQKFCAEFLQNLVNKKPLPPENWTRTMPEITSHKKQWHILKEFLASPTEQFFDYRIAQTERTMMENAIRNVTIDLKMETLKKGTPHTLRLTKTQDHYNRELKKWNEDVNLLEKLSQ